MKIIDTVLVALGVIMTVITLMTLVPDTIQAPVKIIKGDWSCPQPVSAKYLSIPWLNGHQKSYLDKRGAGYGMAFYCDIHFIQK